MLTGLSILGIFYQIFAKYFIAPDTPQGFTTVIILIVLFGGLTLLGISFLGEYISKIFEETKKRPKFIRTKIQKGEKTFRTSEEIMTLVKQRKK
jgi:hypothetical protein